MRVQFFRNSFIVLIINKNFVIVDVIYLDTDLFPLMILSLRAVNDYLDFITFFNFIKVECLYHF